MSDNNGQGSETEFLGKVLFLATAVAVLAFFWWLLIYNHGVGPAG